MLVKVTSLQSNLDQNVQQLTIAEHKINELTLDNSQVSLYYNIYYITYYITRKIYDHIYNRKIN